MICVKGLDLYTLVVAIRFGYNNTEKGILLGEICMGSYLNPGTKGFQESLNSKIYIDKTGLIEKPMRFLIHGRNSSVLAAHAVFESQWLQICWQLEL